MTRALATALLLCLCAAQAAGRELWRRGEASLAVSGSVRELLTGTHGTDLTQFGDAAARDGLDCGLAKRFPDCGAFDVVNDEAVVVSLTRVRTRVDLRVNEHLSAVAAYDMEFFGGHLDTFEAELGSDLARDDTLLGAEGNAVRTDAFRWRHVLYRGYLFFESEHAEVTVGRQRIPWGVGRLWNPIDRFNPISPLSLQPDQSPGVDAVNLRWLFSGFTFLEGVFAPERDFDDSAYALRLHGVLRDIDYSIVGGVFEGARTFGFDLAGNVRDAAARVEFVFTDPTRKVRKVTADTSSEIDPYVQLVVSADYLNDVGSGLYVLVEHLYNGNDLGFGEGRAGTFLPLFEARNVPGLPVAVVAEGTTDLFGGSRVVTFAENQTGFQLGYDVTPELRAELLSLYDWNGESASFFPSFRWTPFDWLELTLGGQFFVGPRLSQYGDQEHLGFLLAEVFF